MADGPLSGLLARAVIVVGKDGKFLYGTRTGDFRKSRTMKRRLRQLGNNRFGLNYTIKKRWMKKGYLYPPFFILIFSVLFLYK